MPYLLPSDVASLNQIQRDEDKGRRTSDMFFPDDVKDNQLNVVLIPPPSTNTPIASKPDYSMSGASRKGTKRKRPTTKGNNLENQEKEGQTMDDGGWTTTADGKTMVKRVRNQIMKKPIAIVVDSSSPTGSSPLTYDQAQAEASSQLPGEALSQPDSFPRGTEDGSGLSTCDGPGIAHILRKFIETFEDIQIPGGDTVVVYRCCDHCRTYALQAVHCLRDVLLPPVAALEEIDRYVFKDSEIPPSQHDDISPCKRDQRRKSARIVLDSNDD